MGGMASPPAPLLPEGCKATGAMRLQLLGDVIRTTQSVRCEGDVSGSYIGLDAAALNGSNVLLRIVPLGQPVQTRWLNAEQSRALIEVHSDRWQVMLTYVRAGIEHILTGYDHLLFVVALVLLLEMPWSIAKAVTAFTIAHSVTLIGSTLGVFVLPQRPVEASIALSIMFLASEIAARTPGRLRLSQKNPWVVAFLFGLLHGFGFAGALAEIGLPRNELSTALLSFNVGVELGQLGIVAATVMLRRALKRLSPKWVDVTLRMMTLAIGGTASYWFIERLLT